MSMVAFLVGGDATAATLKPAIAERLARLGVTSVAFLRDDELVCVVIEGWAFDAATSSAAAAAAIGADSSTSRTFHPVMQSALRAWNEET